MPIYTYECQKCNHEFEKLQKLNDPNPDTCPNCGAKKTLERTMGLSSFQLKGGGWYKDGY